MRAVVCHELGPPDGLRIDTREDLAPGDGQVVVDVAAAGVNFVDSLFVSGEYQIKPALPFVPGSEIAGTVRSTGAGVTDFKPGDRVMANCWLGGFAEQVALTPAQVIALPSALDAPRAATFTQSYCTALFSLRDRAGVQPGESVLVLGAGGGVGLATIDVAKALGARVLAAASTAEKRDAALAAGADEAVDSNEDLKTAARAWAGGTGLDIVADPVGGSLAEPGLRALGNNGRYLVIGFASGTIPSLPMNQILLRNRSVVGVDWGAWSLQTPAANRALIEELLAMVAGGSLHPAAPTLYPMERAAEALDDLRHRRAVGKIALTMS